MAALQRWWRRGQGWLGIRTGVAAFVAYALVTSGLPAPTPPLELPTRLGPHRAHPWTLPTQTPAACADRRTTTAARYGIHRLVVVGGGAAPLRFARALACLGADAGGTLSGKADGRPSEVVEVGVDEDTVLPAAVYNRVAAGGRIERVRVSLVAGDGRVATSAAQAVVAALVHGSRGWRLAVRVDDWDESVAERAGFDALLAPALGVRRPTVSPALALR